MESLDSESERKRLTELYSQMSLGDLEKLADSAETLTERAQEALKAELIRRGSDIRLSDPVVDPAENQNTRVVILERFRDLPSALLAKSVLDSAGIQCFLSDENVIRMDWLWSNALGGIKLQVREEDCSLAAELLKQKLTDSLDMEDIGEYTQPRCPGCGSLDISYGERGRRLAYATIAVGVPLPVERSGWKCNSCGHEWNDSETDPQAR